MKTFISLRATTLIFLFTLVFLVPSMSNSGNVLVTYPAPLQAERSSWYRVYVNGKESFVYDNPVAAFTGFDFSGKVEVVIHTGFNVKWVDIRPLRLGIKPVWNDSTIRFTLTENCKISIELNRMFEDTEKPLFLFANPPETDVPDKDDPDVIYFEAGRIYDVGLLEIGSGQTLYIEGGAVVKGSLLAWKADHVTIRGRGILYANGIRGKLKDKRLRWMRAINIVHCRHVQVRDIIVDNSDTWQVVPVMSEDVRISGVKLISGNGSDDGIDIVRCRNVLIQDCFIRTKDDCIAIKAFMEDKQYRGDSGVIAQHCVLWNAEWGNAMEIGFETRAHVISDITFRDMDVIHVERGAVMSIHHGDDALIRKVRYEDIRIEDAKDKLIDMAIFRSQYSRDKPASPEENERLYMHGAWDGVIRVPPEDSAYHAGFRGRIRDVTFRNIRLPEGRLPYSIIYGYDKAHDIRDITIEGLFVCGKEINDPADARFFIKNTGNIVFRDVK